MKPERGGHVAHPESPCSQHHSRVARQPRVLSINTTMKASLPLIMTVTPGLLVLAACSHRKAPQPPPDQPPSLIGKQLVLERSDAPGVYPFPRKHGLRITIPEDDGSSTILYHFYNAKKGEFYEETRVKNPSSKTPGEYSSTRWKLQFTEPDTGTATLIDRKGKALSNKKIGYTVTFLVEPIIDKR